MMGCFFNKKPPPEIAFILRVLDETSVMNLAQLYAEARDKFQSQELMAKVNDRIKAVLKESGPSSTENQMTQPIDRDTAIALAKEANGLNVAIAASGVFMFSGNDLVRFYGLAVAHSRKDAEPVAYQYRMKPEWHDAWVKWQPCDKANFDDYVKAPVINGWQFEARALFTHPPEADKLLQQALEALEGLIGPSGGVGVWKLGGSYQVNKAMNAIRTYLEGKIA